MKRFSMQPVTKKLTWKLVRCLVNANRLVCENQFGGTCLMHMRLACSCTTRIVSCSQA